MTRSIDASRALLLERVHTEGVFFAYDSAISIIRDPKAPANARATAVSAIFRVAGYFKNGDDGTGEKQPFEMSPEELSEAVAKIERGLKDREQSIFE